MLYLRHRFVLPIFSLTTCNRVLLHRRLLRPFASDLSALFGAVRHSRLQESTTRLQYWAWLDAGWSSETLKTSSIVAAIAAQRHVSMEATGRGRGQDVRDPESPGSWDLELLRCGL